jgi:hypothetical protein
VAEVAELQQHAAAQAALLNVGREEADTMEESTSGARVGSDS